MSVRVRVDLPEKSLLNCEEVSWLQHFKQTLKDMHAGRKTTPCAAVHTYSFCSLFSLLHFICGFYSFRLSCVIADVFCLSPVTSFFPFLKKSGLFPGHNLKNRFLIHFARNTKGDEHFFLIIGDLNQWSVHFQLLRATVSESSLSFQQPIFHLSLRLYSDPKSLLVPTESA